MGHLRAKSTMVLRYGGHATWGEPVHSTFKQLAIFRITRPSCTEDKRSKAPDTPDTKVLNSRPYILNREAS